MKMTLMQETRFVVSGQTGSMMLQQTAYSEYFWLWTISSPSW